MTRRFPGRLPAALLLALGAAACFAAPPTVVAEAPPPCPTTDRDALLLQQPEQLVPCRTAAEREARAYAAHALAQLNRPAEAAPLYDRLREEWPELAPLFSWSAASAHAAAGAPPATILASLGSEAGVPDYLATRRLVLRAETLLAAGDTAAARETAEAAGKRGAAAARVTLIHLKAALHGGELSAAAAALDRLQLKHPATEEARLGAELLGPAADLERLTPGQRAERWAALRADGPSEQVVAECQPLLEVDGAVTSSGLLECARAHANTRHPRAAELLERAATGQQRVPALATLSRVIARRDDTPSIDAITAVCDRLEAAGAGSELSDCRYLAALQAVELGEREPALRMLAAVERRFGKTEKGREAGWMQGFVQWRTDRPAALAVFDRLAHAATDPEDKARALYWRGRSRPEEAADAARQDWQEALRLDPDGYYGLVASVRLGAPVPTRAIAVDALGDAATVPEAGREAALLLSAGYVNEAARSLDTALKRPVVRPLEWLAFLQKAGRYDAVCKLASGRQSPLDEARRQTARYPLAFPTQLRLLPPDVDRFFVLSLMRAESLYDPGAVSVVKARGLLQLIMPTATKLAAELGLPAPTAESLHDPATNIRLSGRYVQRLDERFHHPFLVAASYNAGPHNVARWLERRAGEPMDLFVERIPFRETRHYVKRVAANQRLYQRLYADRVTEPALDTLPIQSAGVDY